MRLLLVEDDPRLAQQIDLALQRAGYVVELAANGRDGQYLGATLALDAAILDLGLPLVDGLTLLREWRRQGLRLPVLILTARDTWREKVEGLRAGADDYLAKPFAMEELLARIEALIRRAAGHAGSLLACGNLTLDLGGGHFTLGSQRLELTGYEYKTLDYLMHHQGKVISKTELTEHIYDQDFDLDSNVIEVLINRLRKKLGADWIRTHRGRGYQLVAPGDGD
jgi:two-component system OmpR family response regulator